MSDKKPLNKLFLLKNIVEGTASYTGTAFFRNLVKTLAETLDLHGVWVTVYDPEVNFLRAQAFWLKNKYVEKYDYAVPGTPCEPVLQTGEVFHVPDRVIELYPDDPDLPPLGAVSYMGIALKSENGDVMGHLAALDNKPMKELPEYFAVFKIFATRAEAELRRMRYEQQLRQNEIKLNRIFNGVVNGILELDSHFTITQANQTAALQFGYTSSGELIGLPIQKFVTSDSFHAFQNFTTTLMSTDKRSPQMKGQLEFMTNDGSHFYADINLSRAEYKEQDYFILFFNNIQDKLEAEKTIKQLATEKLLLEEDIKSYINTDGIIGNSNPIRQALKLVKKVAPTDTTVLLTGETGTGKELFARAIHMQSTRKNHAMATINCAALPAELIESELFGHVKGAFTGAHQARDGRFLQANKSTLFLDEIGEMSLPLQAKLLRVLQEGEIQPVGSSEIIKVDVRIIAATNRNLKDEVEKGNFREDLFYRLHIFPIHLPALRERGTDILDLAAYFIRKFNAHANPDTLLTDEQKNVLLQHKWPGNIRELQNTIERAMILAGEGAFNLIPLIQPTVSGLIQSDNAQEFQIMNEEQFRELERKNIVKALEMTHWKISGNHGAASLLGLPATTLTSRMKALNIHKKH